MGQCFSEPLVADAHGRETEAKYRAKWNDIRDGAGQLQQQQRIKTNLQYTTTADVGLKRHDVEYGRYGGFDDQGGVELDPIDEYKSLHVPSPLKQSQHHASPMKNAAAHIGAQHGALVGEDQPLGSRQGQSQYQAQSNQTRQSQSQTQQVHVGQQQQLQTPTSWTCGDLIGQGAFGSVYLGMDDDTGHLMAVKQVSLAYAGTASAAKVAEHIKSLEAEVSLLQRLDHPNIVRYLGTERTSKALNIFLEYIPGGSIASLLAKFGPFKESVVKMFTKQILLGLEYLHRNGIMHRDIKGANILVDNTGMVKLADFGASKQIEDLVTIGSGANSVKGTPYWMAPEVITQTGHGRQADIWSVACTVIEMATGKPPWSQYGSQVSAMFHIAKSKGPPMIPEEMSPDCKDFLYLCFNRNWRQRPQASTLLQHPFLAGVAVRSMPASVAPRAPDVARQSHQRVISAVRHPEELSRGRDDLRMTAVSAPMVEEGTATSPDPSVKKMENAVRESRSMNESYQAKPRRQLNLDAVATNKNGMTNAQGPRRASAGHQDEHINASSKRPVVRASAPVFPLADRCEPENFKRAASSRPPLPAIGSQKIADYNDGRQSMSEKSSASRQSSGSLPSSKGEQERYASFIMSPNGINAMSLASQDDQSISKSGTSSSKQYSSGGSIASGSNFNPIVEPEGAQQQARLAIDSLKVALAASENDKHKYSREEQRHSQAASLASSGSCGESTRPYISSASGEANKSYTGPGRSAGVSDGPIVYTIAADASNDSSVPGLPWDAGHSSWSLSSRPMSNTTSSAFNSRSLSLSNGQSTGVSKDTVSSKSNGSQVGTNGTFSSGQLRSSSSDIEKSIASEDRSFQRSRSGSLSYQSSDSGKGRASTSSSCGEELPRRLSSLRSSGRDDPDKTKNDTIVSLKSKEFQTPRRYGRSMSGASTPVGPSPCHIPRPPPYHGPASPLSGATGIIKADSSGNNMAGKTFATSGPVSMTPRRSLPATPRRNPSPAKRASKAATNGGDCIGTYEQQHLKQLEMKRSGPFAGRSTPSRTPRPADASRYTTPRKREPASHVSASVSAIPSARKASRTPAPGARSEQQFVIPR